MASSTHEQHHLHHLPTPYATTTTAPPPTPSTQQPNHLSSSEAADSLSRLLHRLPPTLSLSFPNRRQSPPSTTTSPPLISLSDPKPSLHANLLSAAQKYGFFQLTDHPISPHLATLAESDSLSIFNKKQLCSFPKNNWPLGFDEDEDDNDDESVNKKLSLCLDTSCSIESTELELTSLREFTCQMEKLGLEVIQELACAVGFENPFGDDPTRLCSLMWISEGGSSSNKQLNSGRLYPFVVGLHYQVRCRKYTMLADSGWVSVSPQVDSVLVTLGDIAQVWSNGKVKKVRGRPVPLEEANSSSNSQCLSMTLLVTLPLDSTVSPLLPKSVPLAGSGEDEITMLNEEDNDLGENNSKLEESPLFNTFSFEDYAWRVYHERLLLKDPLVRYRV